jgi:hypothetical protein
MQRHRRMQHLNAAHSPRVVPSGAPSAWVTLDLLHYEYLGQHPASVHRILWAVRHLARSARPGRAGPRTLVLRRSRAGPTSVSTRVTLRGQRLRCPTRTRHNVPHVPNAHAPRRPSAARVLRLRQRPGSDSWCGEWVELGLRPVCAGRPTRGRRRARHQPDECRCRRPRELGRAGGRRQAGPIRGVRCCEPPLGRGVDRGRGPRRACQLRGASDRHAERRRRVLRDVLASRRRTGGVVRAPGDVESMERAGASSGRSTTTGRTPNMRTPPCWRRVLAYDWRGSMAGHGWMAARWRCAARSSTTRERASRTTSSMSESATAARRQRR